MTVFRRDPDREFKIWHMSEIFLGLVGQTTDHLFVPNVEDIVYDGGNRFFKVIAVDNVTAIPTLEAFDPSNGFNTGITDPDSLLDGLRSYDPQGLYRIFLDTSITPYVLTVVSRYRIYGSEATSAKLFLGTNTSPAGTVISQTINSNNAVISEMIDLEPTIGSNNTIKRPVRFNTTRQLDDGERVTLVVYNDNGSAIEERPFIIRNAGAIAGPGASSNYIVDIELISDLISTIDPLLIENLLNVPFTVTALICRVLYSNGTYVDLPIDGNKVKLHGIDNFNTGVLGPSTNLVLSYYPDPTEPSINLQGTIQPSISKTYRLANVNPNNNYSVKLYVLPWYDTVNAKYELRFMLVNDDYSLYLDVTNDVTTSNVNNGNVFNGNLFGIEQTLDASIILVAATMPGVPDGVHTQRISITIDDPSIMSNDMWLIDYGNDGITVYGDDKRAIASQLNNKDVDITAGMPDLTTWVDYLYYYIDPLFDSSIAAQAPFPTHYRLVHNGVEFAYKDITAWNTAHPLGSSNNWTPGMPVDIQWIVEAGGREEIIAVTPLMIEYN